MIQLLIVAALAGCDGVVMQRAGCVVDQSAMYAVPQQQFAPGGCVPQAPVYQQPGCVQQVPIPAPAPMYAPSCVQAAPSYSIQQQPSCVQQAPAYQVQQQPIPYPVPQAQQFGGYAAAQFGQYGQFAAQPAYAVPQAAVVQRQAVYAQPQLGASYGVARGLYGQAAVQRQVVKQQAFAVPQRQVVVRQPVAVQRQVVKQKTVVRQQQFIGGNAGFAVARVAAPVVVRRPILRAAGALAVGVARAAVFNAAFRPRFFGFGFGFDRGFGFSRGRR